MKKRVISQINTTDTSSMTEFDLTGDPSTYGAFKLLENVKVPFQKVIQNSNQIFNNAILNMQLKKANDITIS